ncbi:MAG: 3'-5' exonuclease domain-containing protein 2 [Bacteroidales bacterium]|nr:3'-5' exonuclease domain-containing protein 2 [Bacteroidales bacterium]
MSNQDFKCKISKEEIELLPREKFLGEIFYIDSNEALQEFIVELKDKKVLGFDTETRPAFKKGVINEVSLLQLSTGDQAFLFRLNEISDHSEIKALLSNPSIIKAGVAIHDDIIGLQRLFNFKPAGFIELQDYVKDFGIEDNSLKKLSANILGFQISKRQQTSNWEVAQLSQAQIEYAATDAWVCYEIYSLLKKVKPHNGHQHKNRS